MDVNVEAATLLDELVEMQRRAVRTKVDDEADEREAQGGSS